MTGDRGRIQVINLRGDSPEMFQSQINSLLGDGDELVTVLKDFGEFFWVVIRCRPISYNLAGSGTGP